MSQQKRDHHYVPEALLKPWVVNGQKGNSVLLAYSWNKFAQAIHCKDNLGLNGYCYERDLFTLTEHPDGKDVLEAQFFEKIDSDGAKAVDTILREGLRSLSDSHRRDFVYFLLSLEARRPHVLKRLRGDGVAALRRELDADEEIKALLKSEEIDRSPSEYFESNVAKLEDRALLAVLPFLTKRSIGLQSLENCHWLVRKMKPDSLRLVLADRPLIRMGSSKDADRIWCLPLSPNVLFLASPNRSFMAKFLKESDNQLVRSVNANSVTQRERFVFGVDRDSSNWMAKLMRSKNA